MRLRREPPQPTWAETADATATAGVTHLVKELAAEARRQGFDLDELTDMITKEFS